MISKELLSSVLGLTVVKGLELEGIVLWYNGIVNINNQPPYAKELNINIYELAHKCKEWAVNLSPNKHALSSYPRWGDIRNYKKTNGSYYICQHLVSGVQFEAETEPEAIFKACEWILKQVEKK